MILKTDKDTLLYKFTGLILVLTLKEITFETNSAQKSKYSTETVLLKNHEQDNINNFFNII